MTPRLLIEHNLEFLTLKGGCTGSSESTLVKMLHCWKSHTAAHFVLADSRAKIWPVKSIEALNMVSAAVRSKVVVMLLFIY